MGRRSFVDTNVLVYRFDYDEPKMQSRAREILEEEGSAGQLVLSTQVLQEFFVTVTRKLARPLAKDAALAAIRQLAQFPVVQIDVDLIERAILLSRDHQLSFWDSLILSAAAESRCSVVLTEDLQDGFEVLGLRVENPFAALS
jgi:predicted nucleic acid-binding protein